MAGTENDLDPNVEDQNLDQDSDQDLDTQDNPTTPTDGGHVASQKSPNDTQPAATDDAKVQAALREYGKLQQVQQELEQYKEKATYFDNVNSAAMQSPEKYKRVLMATYDATEAEADAAVQELRRQGHWQSPTTPTQPNLNQQSPQSLDPNAIVQLVQRATQDTVQRETFKNEFKRQVFERLPELSPENVADEDKELMGTLVRAAEYEATRRVQGNNKLDLVEEFVNVYTKMTGRKAEDIQKAQKEGRMQGYLEANAGKAASGKSPKGYSSNEETYGLSPAEIAEANAEGLSLQDYAELKDPVVKVKERKSK